MYKPYYSLAFIATVALSEDVATRHARYVSTIVRVSVGLMCGQKVARKKWFIDEAVGMRAPECLVDEIEDRVACLGRPLKLV